MKRLLYIAVDAHSKSCTIGVMSAVGKMLDIRRIPTTEQHLCAEFDRYEDARIRAVVEESSLASWVSQSLHSRCESMTIANPMHNQLISSHANKCDETDVESLCELLRLGSIKSVYRPEEDDRSVFKGMVQHYHDLTKRESELKQQIKAKYLQLGIVDTGGRRALSPMSREQFLERVGSAPMRHQIERLYQLLDLTLDLQGCARDEAWSFGTSRYPELREFVKVPGVGPIGAMTFSSYIYTPERFTSLSALYRYCRLGIRSRSSDGKALSRSRLDRCGNSELKSVAYRAWLTGMRVSGGSVISQYYERSLRRTGNPVHARLNTQRKVISVLYGIWKSGEPYRPERFLGSDKLAA